MEIPTSSSKAQDRELAVWYQKIQNGDIKLPRFQRHEAWDRQRIASFLNTIIHNLPVGVTLLLEVGDAEKFPSRHLEGAPAPARRPHEHLLDGQQRLTALYRALNNDYEDQVFFVYIPVFDNTDDDKLESDDIFVYCQPRWTKNETRYPVWADNARSCFEKGLVPVHLLRPEPLSKEIDGWVEQATLHLEPADDAKDLKIEYQKYQKKQKELKETITLFREVVAHFNLPYLALPVQTPKATALQVFINMNTNTKPLSTYDIIVAEVEGARGASLHALQAHACEILPDLESIDDISRLILATSALIQNRQPNERGMIEMDKALMVDTWGRLERCLGNLLSFVEREKVFDRLRLPTNAPLPVVAALYDVIPDSGDERGKADILLRKYLWSSFFTDRYENAAATRAYADYRGLLAILKKDTKDNGQPYAEQDVPIFNRLEYPIANAQEMALAPWPKSQTILGRAIVAVCNYLGALDFADGSAANRDNLTHREYHHIFPDALLTEAEINSYLALNCALISGPTNRAVGRKDPLDYIKDRYGWVDEQIVEQRLNSHLIPVTLLKQASYQGLDAGAKATKVQADFTAFLKARADLMCSAAQALAEGRQARVPCNP